MVNVIKVKIEPIGGEEINAEEELYIEEAEVYDNGYSGFYLPREAQIGIGNSPEPFRTKILNSWREGADDYNNWVESIFAIPGFQKYFLSHGHYLTKKQIEEQFGKDAAKVVFREHRLSGTQFKNYQDVFCDDSCSFKASFEVEGKKFSYNLESAMGDTYKQDEIYYFFNWAPNKYYTGHALLFQFANDGVLYGKLDCTSWLGLDVDDISDDEPLPSILETAKDTVLFLEAAGYLRTYSMEPEDPEMNELWKYYAYNGDGSVEFSILEPDYAKDQGVCKQIRNAFKEMYIEEYAEEEVLTDGCYSRDDLLCELKNLFNDKCDSLENSQLEEICEKLIARYHKIPWKLDQDDNTYYI